jgi:autonomous glycyl radical cofactor GrcA
MDSSVAANRAFLNFFWDLASDDAEKRVAAGNSIIGYTFESKKVSKLQYIIEFELLAGALFVGWWGCS